MNKTYIFLYQAIFAITSKSIKHDTCHVVAPISFIFITLLQPAAGLQKGKKDKCYQRTYNDVSGKVVWSKHDIISDHRTLQGGQQQIVPKPHISPPNSSSFFLFLLLTSFIFIDSRQTRTQSYTFPLHQIFFHQSIYILTRLAQPLLCTSIILF